MNENTGRNNIQEKITKSKIITKSILFYIDWYRRKKIVWINGYFLKLWKLDFSFYYPNEKHLLLPINNIGKDGKTKGPIWIETVCCRNQCILKISTNPPAVNNFFEKWNKPSSVIHTSADTITGPFFLPSYTVASKWLIIFWPHPLWIPLSIILESLLFGKSSNGALRVTKSDLVHPLVFKFPYSILLIEFTCILFHFMYQLK